MPKSYRFRTIPGTDRDVRIKIDQDFDFLEILSLKLRQEDLYSRFCADYGVVAGRVIANGGYGVPNVNISIFVHLSSVDESDPIISTLYPYKTPQDKNEDGFRYNLLPYVQEYRGHTPTGTFPSRHDILTRKEVLEVYEKYYKYTVKTNESGDFMIIGVPLGSQTVMMDLDLSNIGCFSFISPEKVLKQRELFLFEEFLKKWEVSKSMEKFHQFLNFVSYKYRLQFDGLITDFEEFLKEERETIVNSSSLESDYKTFLDNHEHELEKKFNVKNKTFIKLEKLSESRQKYKTQFENHSFHCCF
jgi:hypothetical protein